MAMAPTLDQEAFDALPETISPKDEYKKQEDGTFILDVPKVGGFALENIDGLTSSLSKTLTVKKSLEKKLKEFEGLDPAKAREALVKMEELASGKLDDKSKAQIEAAINSFKEKATKDIETAQTEAAKYKKAALGLAKTNVIKDALLKHKANQNLKYYLETFIKAELSESGAIDLTLQDENGNVRYSSKSGSTEPMTVDEHVAELKGIDSFAAFFEGTGASGSGATPASPVKIGSGQHIIAREDAKDPQKYRVAKEAATKAGTTLQIAEK